MIKKVDAWFEVGTSLCRKVCNLRRTPSIAKSKQGIHYRKTQLFMEKEHVHRERMSYCSSVGAIVFSDSIVHFTAICIAYFETWGGSIWTLKIA